MKRCGRVRSAGRGRRGYSPRAVRRRVDSSVLSVAIFALALAARLVVGMNAGASIVCFGADALPFVAPAETQFVRGHEHGLEAGHHHHPETAVACEPDETSDEVSPCHPHPGAHVHLASSDLARPDAERWGATLRAHASMAALSIDWGHDAAPRASARILSVVEAAHPPPNPTRSVRLNV